MTRDDLGWPAFKIKETKSYNHELSGWLSQDKTEDGTALIKLIIIIIMPSWCGNRTVK